MARMPLTGTRQGNAKLVTFEVQSRTARAWRTVAIFDDRAAAVGEAERILAGRRTPAVRVVQAIYNADSSECREYTVFRATCLDEASPQAGAGPGSDNGMAGDDENDRHEVPARRSSNWLPDWPTTALTLSLALLCFSVLFLWVR